MYSCPHLDTIIRNPSISNQTSTLVTVLIIIIIIFNINVPFPSAKNVLTKQNPSMNSLIVPAFLFLVLLFVYYLCGVFSLSLFLLPSLLFEIHRLHYCNTFLVSTIVSRIG